MKIFDRKNKKKIKNEETDNIAEHINFFFDSLNDEPRNSRQNKFDKIMNAIVTYNFEHMFDSTQAEVVEKLSLLLDKILANKARLKKHGLTPPKLNSESDGNIEELLAEYIKFIPQEVTTRLTT